MAVSSVDQRIEDELARTDGTNQAAGIECSFRDWQFIDKSSDHVGSSDDESIEIIEREVASPVLSYTNSEASETEEDEKDNVQPEPVSVEIVDRRIQTTESSACQSCLQVARTANRMDVTNSISWKIIYFFSLSICTGLIIHRYKELADIFASSVTDGVSLPIKEPDSIFGESVSRQNIKSEDSFDNLASQLQRDILQRKQMVDQTLADQLDFMSCVKHVDGDVYLVDVSELDLKLARRSFASSFHRQHISRLSKAYDEIQTCYTDLTSSKLPSVCKTSKGVVVLLKKSDLLEAYRDFEKILHDIGSRFDSSLDILVKTTMLPEWAYYREAEDSNLVSDGDNFSKFSKPINRFVERNPTSANDKANAEAQFPISVEKPEVETQLPACEREPNVESQLSKSEEQPAGTPSKVAGKLTAEYAKHEEITVFLQKFKRDFENLYRMYIAVDEPEEMKTASSRDTVADTATSHAQDGSVDKNATDAEESDVAEPVSTPEPDLQTEKPISGEWFFNLNEARAELRKYYTQAINGDWILKLGKAREKLRKFRDDWTEKWNSAKSEEKETPKKKDWFQNVYENLQNDFDKVSQKWMEMFGEKKEKKRKRWYDKTEELKDGIKKYSSQLKQRMKKVREDFVNNYEHLQSKFKDAFGGYV